MEINIKNRKNGVGIGWGLGGVGKWEGREEGTSKLIKAK